MNFDDAIDDTGTKDVEALLESIDLATATEQELRDTLVHLRSQFKNRYEYLVGEWMGARRVKRTRDGVFASRQEVLDYLEGK